MSIYQIDADLNNYKSFFPIEDDDNLDLQLDEYFDFHAEPRTNWVGARMFMEESFTEDKGKLVIGDIAYFSASAFAYSEKAVSVLKPILELCGELLPFNYDGQQWYVHNILNSIKAIDHEKSKYEINDSGRFEHSDRVMDESKLNQFSLFKLYEDNNSVSRCHDVEKKEFDFKFQVEKHGLKGIKFAIKR